MNTMRTAANRDRRETKSVYDRPKDSGTFKSLGELPISADENLYPEMDRATKPPAPVEKRPEQVENHE
jgi:hypothetical protein